MKQLLMRVVVEAWYGATFRMAKGGAIRYEATTRVVQSGVVRYVTIIKYASSKW